MNIEQMKKSVKTAFEANQPVMIWGAPGVGKSQGIEQLCAELGYDFIDVRLSQMDAVDLRGIPYRDQETCKTDWATPKIWPTDPSRTAVIMFDEINHGTQSTLSAAFQIIQEHKLGDFVFPPNTKYIAAGNRAKDRTYANQMPSALRNRFTHIEVEASEDDWVKWANKNGFNPLITGFIRFSPTSLNEFEEHSESKEEQKRVAMVKTKNAFATPRSWDAINRFVNLVTDQKTQKVNLDRVNQLIIGTIGEEQAAKFVGYANHYKDLPDLGKLLKNPKAFDVPTEPALQFAIAAGLSNVVKEKTFPNMIDYILRMPAEFQAMCVKDSLARNMMLSTSPAFATWAAENNDILF